MQFRNHDLRSAEAYRLSIDGHNHRLSEHFMLGEMASRDGADLVLVHEALIEGLEALREKLGSPIHINSAYRSFKHNRSIPGARNSRHLWGLAADIVSRRHSPQEVADAAEALGFGGVGRYASFVHVDVFGMDRRWTG